MDTNIDVDTIYNERSECVHERYRYKMRVNCQGCNEKNYLKELSLVSTNSIPLMVCTTCSKNKSKQIGRKIRERTRQCLYCRIILERVVMCYCCKRKDYFCSSCFCKDHFCDLCDAIGSMCDTCTNCV